MTKLLHKKSGQQYTLEQIEYYLHGLLLVGEHKENDMLNCAISLLDDFEDGIDAVHLRKNETMIDNKEH